VGPWGVALPGGRVRIKGDNTGTYQGLLLHIPGGEKLDIDFVPVAIKPPFLQSVRETYIIEVESGRRERQEVLGEASVAPAAFARLTQLFLVLFLLSFTAAFCLLGYFVLTIELPAIPPTPTASLTPTGPTPTPRVTATYTFTPQPTGTLTFTPPPTGTPTLSATPTETSRVPAAGYGPHCF
jgi:hypothetical protein